MLSLIARGAVAEKRAKKASKGITYAVPVHKMDSDRGIQNVAKTVSELQTRQPTGERYLREREERIEKNKNNVEELEDETEETNFEEIQRQEASVAEKQNAENRRRVATSALTNQLIKKAPRTALRLGVGIAVSVFVWQFLFAVVSLIGFGLHAQILYAREQTLTGKVIGLFFDFQKYLPFEYIGYLAWGITVLLTAGVFIGYYYFFKAADMDPFATSLRFIITSVCLGLNLFPVTNLLPWLVLWICYMLLSNKKS